MEQTTPSKRKPLEDSEPETNGHQGKAQKRRGRPPAPPVDISKASTEEERKQLERIQRNRETAAEWRARQKARMAELNEQLKGVQGQAAAMPELLQQREQYVTELQGALAQAFAHNEKLQAAILQRDKECDQLSQQLWQQQQQVITLRAALQNALHGQQEAEDRCANLQLKIQQRNVISSRIRSALQSLMDAVAPGGSVQQQLLRIMDELPSSPVRGPFDSIQPDPVAVSGALFRGTGTPHQHEPSVSGVVNGVRPGQDPPASITSEGFAALLQQLQQNRTPQRSQRSDAAAPGSLQQRLLQQQLLKLESALNKASSDSTATGHGHARGGLEYAAGQQQERHMVNGLAAAPDDDVNGEPPERGSDAQLAAMKLQHAREGCEGAHLTSEDAVHVSQVVYAQHREDTTRQQLADMLRSLAGGVSSQTGLQGAINGEESPVHVNNNGHKGETDSSVDNALLAMLCNVRPTAMLGFRAGDGNSAAPDA